jgi:hypothetical protein
VVPADHKWMCRALVSSILKSEIDALKLKAPSVDGRRRAELAQMREELAAELDGGRRRRQRRQPSS